MSDNNSALTPATSTEAEQPGNSGAQPSANAARKNPRRKLLLGVLAVAVASTLGYGWYWDQYLSHFESTDDAYVSGNMVQITPQVAGTVTAIAADDTNYVEAGQTLVKLDPADAKIAVEEAETQLARTVRQVRNLFAVNRQLEATVKIRESELARAQQDMDRRSNLVARGAISAEELTHAREAYNSALGALNAAREALAANQALTQGTSIDNHPDVRNAASHVSDAYLALHRDNLPAPVSGFVAKRNVQLGQRVAPGAPLMALVPLDQVWVDANFKESQLQTMRVGQPVTLKSDLYGSSFEYHGKVAGFGAGTGGAFALLPAQNATGNWIKVVQRVPVRIQLDAAELAQHPLQLGLSMEVNVDTADQNGARLPKLAATHGGYQTQVFDADSVAAAQRIAEIIAANDGTLDGHDAAVATLSPSRKNTAVMTPVAGNL